MPVQLFPGNLDDFEVEESMAKSIEDALEDLLGALPATPEHVVKDRRRLFIAIAEGVIRHLRDHQDAFEITVDIDNHDPVTVHPEIHTRGL